MSTADREVTLTELGQCFVLPSSYVRGPRYMQQLKQQRNITEWKDASVSLYGIASSCLQVVKSEA